MINSIFIVTSVLVNVTKIVPCVTVLWIDFNGFLVVFRTLFHVVEVFEGDSSVVVGHVELWVELEAFLVGLDCFEVVALGVVGNGQLVPVEVL
jgi:hypothetical protein